MNKIKYVEIFAPKVGCILWGARIQIENPLNYIEVEGNSLKEVLENIEEVEKEVNGND